MHNLIFYYHLLLRCNYMRRRHQKRKGYRTKTQPLGWWWCWLTKHVVFLRLLLHIKPFYIISGFAFVDEISRLTHVQARPAARHRRCGRFDDGVYFSGQLLCKSPVEFGMTLPKLFAPFARLAKL